MTRYWIRLYAVTWCIVIGRFSETPAFRKHVPMHAGVGDDRLETFELAHYERTVGPGAGVGDLDCMLVN